MITAKLAAVAGLWETYIIKKMVPGLKRNLLAAQFAEPAMLPKNSGVTARWNIPVHAVGSTTSLTEGGTDGEITSTTINNVEATIAQKGEWMKVSDLAEETQITGALDVYADQFTYRGSSAIDKLILDEARTSTTFLHSGDLVAGGTTLATGDVAKATDFAAIAGILRGNDAEGWDSLMGDYAWLVNPSQEVDLITSVSTSELSWSDINKHVPEGFGQLMRNHKFVGRLGGVTAMRTNQIGTVTEDVTAYHSIALARYAVGWLGLGMKGPKAPTVKIKRPGPGDTSQPLDMFMTIGWKVNAVAKLLDSSRAVVVYSATV